MSLNLNYDEAMRFLKKHNTDEEEMGKAFKYLYDNEPKFKLMVDTIKKRDGRCKWNHINPFMREEAITRYRNNYYN